MKTLIKQMRTLQISLDTSGTRSKTRLRLRDKKLPPARNHLQKENVCQLAQFWDPIGLVLPVTIELRIDLQELLSDDIQDKWMKNIQVLNRLLSFEFERKLKPC